LEKAGSLDMLCQTYRFLEMFDEAEHALEEARNMLNQAAHLKSSSDYKEVNFIIELQSAWLANAQKREDEYQAIIERLFSETDTSESGFVYVLRSKINIDLASSSVDGNALSGYISALYQHCRENLTSGDQKRIGELAIRLGKLYFQLPDAQIERMPLLIGLLDWAKTIFSERLPIPSQEIEAILTLLRFSLEETKTHELTQRLQLLYRESEDFILREVQLKREAEDWMGSLQTLYYYFRPWLPESPKEGYVSVLPKARALAHRGEFSNCLSLLQNVFHIDEGNLHHDDLEVLNLIVHCMEQLGSPGE
jgi:flagellin-specific chaperone FliS